MREFRFSTPEAKVVGSLYHTIQLLDAREDTTTVGILGTSELSQQRLVPVPELRIQVSTLLAALTTPQAAAPGPTLLLRLKRFRMAKVDLEISLKGYCMVQADLLTHTNGQYQLLATLDTLLEVSRAFGVTKSIIEKGSRVIPFFLAQNLTRTPAGNAPVYSFTQLEALDSLQKLHIPLYNSPVLTDGVYFTYAAFANQQPNSLQIKVEADGRQRYRVQMVNSEGNTTGGFNPQNIYAAVYKGIPYVATDYGFYKLQKAGNDFLFTGQLKSIASNTALTSIGIFYGAVGALLFYAFSSSKEYYDLMIDYRNGRPLPVSARAAKAVAFNGIADSLQKADLPLFKMPVLAEGLYLTWESFSAQTPDYQVKAQAGNGTVMNIKSIGEGKARRFTSGEMYALVYEGIPYLATRGRYYKLRKVDTDWVFIASASLVEPYTDYGTVLREIRIVPQNGTLEIKPGTKN